MSGQIQAVEETRSWTGARNHRAFRIVLFGWFVISLFCAGAFLDDGVIAIFAIVWGSATILLLAGLTFLTSVLKPYRLRITRMPDGGCVISEMGLRQRLRSFGPDCVFKHVISGSWPHLRGPGGFTFGSWLKSEQQKDIAEWLNEGKEIHRAIGNIRVH